MSDRGIELLKAIAHPGRFAILSALSGRERNVGEIEAASRIGQPTLSQQLGVLRKAGLVESRREAKLVYYRIDAVALEQAQATLAGLSAKSAARRTRDSIKRLGGAAVFARTG